MKAPVWRQGYDVSPLREWARRDLPPAGQRRGWQIQDIDNWIGLVFFRAYHSYVHLDQKGRIFALAVKEEKGTIRPGEKHFHPLLEEGMSSLGKRWRGIHSLHIEYTNPMPTCECCGAPNGTPDDAYRAFVTAKLTFDGKEVSPEKLREHFFGLMEWDMDD